MTERVALFPGSFDPLTLGHEEIARRTLALADRVIVAVAHAPTQAKPGLFTVEERLEMIRASFADEPRVECRAFAGLLVDLAAEAGASVVVRGVRTVADFEYELQMAMMNRELSRSLETVFLAPDPRLSFISSTLVRQIAGLGGDVSGFVSPPVLARLRARFPDR